MGELPIDDIFLFMDRYSLGRDANPFVTMGSLHFLRVKVPGGLISSEQLRGVAEIAETYGKGRGEITDRQDIQLHWIKAEDSLEIFSKMERLGFVTDMCGQGFSDPKYGDVRNLVCCPASGVERGELIDPRPLLGELSDYFIGNLEFHDMPRKFKISISGCGSDCTRGITNDLALSAVEKNGELGYALLGGGGVGASLPGFRIAKPLGVFIRPEEAFEVVVKTVEIHRDHSSRESKAKARFKWLLDAWGIEKFIEVLEEKLGRSLEKFDEPVFQKEDGHTGIRLQKQEKLHYVNVPTLGGRITSRDMILFADLADKYGDGDLRLTPRQNIIIANIKETVPFLDELNDAGFSLKVSELKWNSVGCASDFCGKTVAPHCKEMLVATVNKLENGFDLEALNSGGFRIHVSGCANNCCAKEIAGIGLSGILIREGEKTKQGYDIFLGGEFGMETCVGRLIESRIPAFEVPSKVERLVANYLAKRPISENFSDFCSHHSLEELRAYLQTEAS